MPNPFIPSIAGPDCSLTSGHDLWTRVATASPPAGRASAASILLNDEIMCVSGGYAFGQEVDFLVT